MLRTFQPLGTALLFDELRLLSIPSLNGAKPHSARLSEGGVW
jgi:hypothetical protein